MFTRDLFTFFADLSENNDRAWFAAHKADYERHVKGPCLAFIEAVRPGLQALSPHVRCDARALFRIHRDTRFSADKTPYKTSAGLHFRHEAAGDAHAPGLYLHLANDGCFMGAGIWQPDGPTLQRLRAAIVEAPQAWLDVDAAVLRGGLRPAGDSLKRPPRGVDPTHPAVELLRRKDHIAMDEVPVPELLSPEAADAFVRRCDAAAPLMRQLCQALDLPW